MFRRSNLKALKNHLDPRQAHALDPCWGYQQKKIPEGGTGRPEKEERVGGERNRKLRAFDARSRLSRNGYVIHIQDYNQENY